MANLVAGSLLSLRIVPGNKSRFEIHPNLIKNTRYKRSRCFFDSLIGWDEERGSEGGPSTVRAASQKAARRAALGRRCLLLFLETERHS